MTRGIYLNNVFYDYSPGSYKRSVSLKNKSIQTENTKRWSVTGRVLESRTLTLNLWNNYTIRDGLVETGASTQGYSRLVELLDIVGAKGVSLPIIFRSPEGSTSYVLPTGGIDIEIDNPTGIDTHGTEFRVSLTLQDIDV